MLRKASLIKNNAVLYLCTKSLSTNSGPFPVLEDYFNISKLSPETKESSLKLLSQLDKINKICYAGGGERGQRVHVEKNKKLLPRERIKRLFDEDTDTLELSLQAGLGMEYGDIPGASSISVIGRIHGHYCLVSANDATVKGGTFYPITVVKATRAQSIAELNSIPCIYLVDSGGAFLALQSEIFPDKKHGGRGFYSQAILSSEGVPQIGLVCGSCTAGGAYVPMMCEDSGMVDKIGTMFLGGPPLVKAATGEVITAEDLGGATLHTSVSGCSDYFAKAENDGFEMIRDIVATLDIEPYEEQKTLHDPLYSVNDLNQICGIAHLSKDDVLSIISRIVDGSRFREFKQTYGGSLIAGYALIEGHRVGLLANCNPISRQDALKGGHFIQICQHRNMPIIFLQSSGPLEEKGERLESANDVSTHLNRGQDGLLLRARASMAAAVASAAVPKIAININGCNNDDNYTMCGPGFEPNFNFTWPGASVTYSTNLCAQEKDDSYSSESSQSDDSSSFDQTSSWFQTSRALNDGMIKPSETRKVLAHCLRVFDQKKRMSFFRKEFSVLRF